MSLPRVFPPLLSVLAIALMGVIACVDPLARFVRPPWSYAGALLVVAGLTMNLWSTRYFRTRGTTISPIGQPSTLAQRGLYRISRNPMYLGMLSALVGVGLMLGHWPAFAVVALWVRWVNGRYIAPEELALEQRFGAAYRAYRRRVRRWL